MKHEIEIEGLPEIDPDVRKVIEQHRDEPPCMECGAKDPEEAEKLCICAGDKDDCHGQELWL